MDWWEKSQRDSAFNAGQNAWWGNRPRMSNPFPSGPEQREWYKGYDNARTQQMQQNLKGIGKYK